MTDHSPPVSIPRLQTARLTLREYRMGDFDAYAANLADPDATTFIEKVDRRSAWRNFSGQTGAWLLQGAGWWAIEIRDTGELVGNVGAFFREGWPEIELGWVTLRRFWGQGFASEAAGEAARYSLDVRRERRVTALIEAGNAASLRVAQRLGMRHEADVELWGKPVGRYARTRVLEAQ
jgi:RimJ/RimL family protein N-acetyltransferase